MSDDVERRIVAMLDQPLVCPHGNPIPGLDSLGVSGGADQSTELLPTLAATATGMAEAKRTSRL